MNQNLFLNIRVFLNKRLNFRCDGDWSVSYRSCCSLTGDSSTRSLVIFSTFRTTNQTSREIIFKHTESHSVSQADTEVKCIFWSFSSQNHIKKQNKWAVIWFSFLFCITKDKITGKQMKVFLNLFVHTLRPVAEISVLWWFTVIWTDCHFNFLLWKWSYPIRLQWIRMWNIMKVSCTITVWRVHQNPRWRKGEERWLKKRWLFDFYFKVKIHFKIVWLFYFVKLKSLENRKEKRFFCSVIDTIRAC